MDCVICERPEKDFPMVFRGGPTCSVLCGKAHDANQQNQTPVRKFKRQRKPAKT